MAAARLATKQVMKRADRAKQCAEAARSGKRVLFVTSQAAAARALVLAEQGAREKGQSEVEVGTGSVVVHDASDYSYEKLGRTHHIVLDEGVLPR